MAAENERVQPSPAVPETRKGALTFRHAGNNVANWRTNSVAVSTESEGFDCGQRGSSASLIRTFGQRHPSFADTRGLRIDKQQNHGPNHTQTTDEHCTNLLHPLMLVLEKMLCASVRSVSPWRHLRLRSSTCEQFGGSPMAGGSSTSHWLQKLPPPVHPSSCVAARRLIVQGTTKLDIASPGC